MFTPENPFSLTLSHLICDTPCWCIFPHLRKRWSPYTLSAQVWLPHPDILEDWRVFVLVVSLIHPTSAKFHICSVVSESCLDG